jgi:hypothetical protein
MNPDDPRGATILEELSLVTQLSRAVKFATEPAIVQPNGRACSSNGYIEARRSSARENCKRDMELRDYQRKTAVDNLDVEASNDKD